MHRAAILLVVLTACGNVDPQPVAYPVPYTTHVEVRPETRIVLPGGESRVVEPSYPDARLAHADIVVTTERKLARPTEIVGVIDEHEPSGRQDAAFALLRDRAAAMGADAVVGVEFHHGEEKGEPTHLSGLAVRYVDRLR